MVYVDTSVALAHLLAEDRHPAATLWEQSLISSRLLEYEMWTRIHARRLGRSHAAAVAEFLGRIALIEMLPAVLERALEPFPSPVRTLDSIHLASMDYLRKAGQDVALATFDVRQRRAARKLGVPLFDV